MTKFWQRKINRVTGHRLALLLAIIMAFIAIYYGLKSKKIEQTLNNTYERAFYDLAEYVDNVEVSLAKAQISSSSVLGAKNLSDIWRKADLTVNSLSQIPLNHKTIDVAEKYFNQLSDYAYSLAQKTYEKQALSNEDLENLKTFYVRCKTLNQTVKDLLQNMQSGSISWEELTKEKRTPDKFAQEVANLSVDSFSKIEKDMQDYEGLIYDGPFSEHMTNPNILGLGDEIYSKEMAEEVVKNYLPTDEILKIEYRGMVDGTIRAHYFDIAMKNGQTCYMSITERDGKVLNMCIPREPNYVMIEKEEAVLLALRFLETHGFFNMKESYYTLENNMSTINFAPIQDGVICYPDLVKVKIALDNGEVVGLETKGYLSSHHQRTLNMPKIPMEEARKTINPKLEVFSERRAIIPTDFQTEIETYEFKGRVDDNEFIVYVNSNTGKEEKILMIVDSPGGELAI